MTDRFLSAGGSHDREFAAFYPACEANEYFRYSGLFMHRCVTEAHKIKIVECSKRLVQQGRKRLDEWSVRMST
jgi:hypothetical protein